MESDKGDVKSLAERLDGELDEMVEGMKKKNFKYEDGFTEENIDEILRTHPAFMKEMPSQEEIDNNPLLSGLQQLKYEDDENSPEEQALAYKDDGNWHFKYKLYANAVKAYTGGLDKKCADDALNSTLYANRAAAHFYLKNYRSSVKDSLAALKLEPTKVKSLMRCAQCCDALEKYSDVILWLKKVLSIDPDHKGAQDMLKKAQNGLKVAERNRRKQEKEIKLRNSKWKNLIDAIRCRNVKLNTQDLKPIDEDIVLSREDELLFRSVYSSNSSPSKVHFESDAVKDLVGDGILVWPVLFTYPEHEVSEIIEEFTENSTILDHLEVMFEETAPWDADGTYIIENLEVFYEFNNDGLRMVDPMSTLKDILSAGEITVSSGTPMFIILCKASPFRNIFLSRHSVKW